MSYPTIFKELTIEYILSGYTLKETSETFKVSISAIEEWEQKLKKRGSLEKKALNYPHKKISLAHVVNKFSAKVQMHLIWIAVIKN